MTDLFGNEIQEQQEPRDTFITTEHCPHEIYLVVNKVNGKVYVGKTRFSKEHRWKEHSRDAFSNPRFSNIYFYKAVRKWGANNFDVCLLDRAENRKESSELEKHYIRSFRSHEPAFGYNSSLGGEGVLPNEQVRQKLRDSWVGRKQWWVERGVPHPNTGKSINENQRRGLCRKGKPLSDTAKAHLRTLRGPLSATFGRKRSDEEKARLSAALKGRRLTPEWKANISKGSIGKKATAEARRNGSEAKKGARNPMYGKYKEQHHLYRADITEDQVKALRGQGMPILHIARHLGIGRNIVYARLGKTWKSKSH